MVNALRPLPYCSRPGLSSGKLPLAMASQLGHCFISASTCSTIFSKTISTFVRRSYARQETLSSRTPQVSQVSTLATAIVSFIRVLLVSPEILLLPLPFATPCSTAVSSLSVYEEGRLEFLLFLRVVFSRKIARIRSTTTKRLLITARISGDTLPSKQSLSNYCFRRSTSSRTLILFNVAMAILYHGFFQPPTMPNIKRIQLILL